MIPWPWAALARRLLLAATLAFVAAGCARSGALNRLPGRPTARVSPPAPSTPAATVEPAARYTPGPEGDRVIMVRARVEGPQPLIAGGTARVVVRASAWLWKASGGVVTWAPLAEQPAASMRICLERDGNCLPSAEWQPWAEETSLPLVVDWLGARRLYLAAELRDRDGRPLAASDGYSGPALAVRVALDLCSVLDERTPVAGRPAPIQTAAAARRAAFPVSGSVLIEGGRAAAGGAAGDTITVEVEYAASSAAGPVTQMRVSGQLGPCAAEMPAGVPWEPFVGRRAYKVKLALGWSGYYRCVQFRDAAGNLSPVYCDDISLEGSPSPP